VYCDIRKDVLILVYYFLVIIKLLSKLFLIWIGELAIDSRRSITSYCVFLGNFLVSWKSKRQSIVSKSSSEAEYRALASLVYELQWLQYLCHDLHTNISESFVVYCDNKSAICIAKNPTFHERTKHIEIDCHFVQTKFQEGLIHLILVSSFVSTSPRVSLTTSNVGPRKRGPTSGVGQCLARHVRQGTKEWSDISHQDVPTCH